jgi:hypothetical protein
LIFAKTSVFVLADTVLRRTVRRGVADHHRTDPAVIGCSVVHAAVSVHPTSSHCMPLRKPSKTRCYICCYMLQLSEGCQQGFGEEVPSDQGLYGGPYRTRTCDPLRVMQVRYQLRQRPVQ